MRDHFTKRTVRPGLDNPTGFWTAIGSVVAFWLVVFLALCAVGVL